MKYSSTKIIELGSCAFRQWRADSHCKFIHGYRLIAKFWFNCNDLDEKNWVVDFGGLKGLKDILEKQFDHTLCVASDDPLLEGFKSLHAAGGCDLRIMTDGVGIEKTAEWCLNTADTFIREQTGGRCWVEKVEVWEHEKNSALVTNETVQSISSIITNTEQTVPVKHVENFLEEVQKESGVNVAAVLKQAPIGSKQNQPASLKPANVGRNVTTGYSNLFGGTSWGS